MEVESLQTVKGAAKPLLEPSSPRMTFMEEIICWAAGGEIEVA